MKHTHKLYYLVMIEKAVEDVIYYLDNFGEDIGFGEHTSSNLVFHLDHLRKTAESLREENTHRYLVTDRGRPNEETQPVPDLRQ